jgi:hypothetical protein
VSLYHNAQYRNVADRITPVLYMKRFVSNGLAHSVATARYEIAFVARSKSSTSVAEYTVFSCA